MKRAYLEIAGGFALLAAGVAAGHLFFSLNPLSLASRSTDTLEAGTGYKFINPLLFCKDQNISNYTNSLSGTLEARINEYLLQEESGGMLNEASVYYKDLNDGPWVALNPEMKTVPASLLKVPTAMAIYKRAEEDASFIKKTFSLDATNTVNRSQYFPPKEMIEPGTRYTTEDLVRYMLEDSDNGALYLLGTTLTDREFEDSYSDLGIDAPTDAAGYTINARTYASFFRVLYNASYLERDDSEHLLSLLSQSTFSQGIRAGVPQGVVVADKFGESNADPLNLRLNDCGIIYRAGDPYILCVITRGNDFDSLAKVIAGVSKVVWDTLEEQGQEN